MYSDQRLEDLPQDPRMLDLTVQPVYKVQMIDIHAVERAEAEAAKKSSTVTSEPNEDTPSTDNIASSSEGLAPSQAPAQPKAAKGKGKATKNAKDAGSGKGKGKKGRSADADSIPEALAAQPPAPGYVALSSLTLERL